MNEELLKEVIKGFKKLDYTFEEGELWIRFTKRISNNITDTVTLYKPSKKIYLNNIDSSASLSRNGIVTERDLTDMIPILYKLKSVYE